MQVLLQGDCVFSSRSGRAFASEYALRHSIAGSSQAIAPPAEYCPPGCAPPDGGAPFTVSMACSSGRHRRIARGSSMISSSTSLLLSNSSVRPGQGVSNTWSGGKPSTCGEWCWMNWANHCHHMRCQRAAGAGRFRQSTPRQAALARHTIQHAQASRHRPPRPVGAFAIRQPGHSLCPALHHAQGLWRHTQPLKPVKRNGLRTA